MPDDIEIPARFWQALSAGDIKRIADQGGRLNAEQCALLWRMIGRADEPPKEMEVVVSRADVERIWPHRGAGKKR